MEQQDILYSKSEYIETVRFADKYYVSDNKYFLVCRYLGYVAGLSCHCLVLRYQCHEYHQATVHITEKSSNAGIMS